jgi:TetR/AcrR family transcriptional regulator, transcriptional repressor for nem operon
VKVSRQKAAENRRRIVESAARLFRERGLSSVGVDELGAAAGLSYGGLYSQFGSKDGLTAEAVDEAFRAFADRMSVDVRLSDYVRDYLSPEHRDHRGEGCVVSALGGEIPRQSPSVRARFVAGIKRSHARIKGLLPRPRAAPLTDAEAWSTMATLVGSLILARAVDEPDLADRILLAGRQKILNERAFAGPAATQVDQEAVAQDPSRCSATLLRKASRRLSSLYDSALAGAGLTTTQYALLVEIDRQRSAPPTLTELAEAMVMDRSGLGHGLRPLQRDGLVQLVRGDVDQRSRQIVLTDKGRARRELAAPYWSEAEAQFASTLDEEAAAEFRHRLIAIARNERLVRFPDAGSPEVR